MKKFVSLLLAACMVLTVSAGCSKHSDTYPSRTIELVIPFSEGGASDITARQFAVALEKELGVSISCVNKAAGGTVEGLDFAYAQDADGYTLLWVTNSVLMKEAQQASDVVFSESFEPLLQVAVDITLIMVTADSQFKSMEELISFAKEHPHELTIDGTSPGGFDDYQIASVCEDLGIDLTYVPYSGGSEVKAAVLGKEVDIYQDKIASCLPLIQSGDVVPLAVISDEPITAIPELEWVPTLQELGSDYDVGPWRGLSVRNECDPEVINTLKEACVAAYNSAEFQEYLEINFINIRTPIPQDELVENWEAETESYVPFYEAQGLL